MTVQSDSSALSGARRLSGLKARIFSPTALQKMLAFASLILLLVFFSFASPAFMQMDNILGILQATAVNGVLAIASTFVIITGGIDLSVGTLMTFTAVICGVFLTYWHLPMWLGVLAAIGTGAICGTISGTLTAKMKIPPFIATLGMMLLLKGLSLVVSADKPIYFTDTENFYMISQDSLIGYFVPSLPIPNAVLILFFLAIASSITLNRTALGRYTFALGSNEEAFIMSVLTNGLRIMSVAQEWQIVVTGLIIILAVYADILRRRKR
ncbi:MAG: ABC transporter permease [Burkholderia sp.]|nr:ABC transporter permease [Burkholderia sp.]